MTKHQITIATRESPLALWQANWVKSQLEKIYPSLNVSLLGITTQADKWLETPLTQIGGKGLFVKELEQALLEGRADIAVHSMKDVPMTFPDGLYLPVMCEREEPRDVLVSNRFTQLDELPKGAILGTSSLRRQSQLRALRSDLKIENLRGNVNTRLAKLDNGDFDALILAGAGLKRLGMTQRIKSYLNIEQSLPAVGQGVLGIECREDDEHILKYIMPLNDEITNRCVTAERAMCQRLGGGCQLPVAAYATIEGKQILLRGLVASLDGTIVLRVEQQGELENPVELGLQVAADLLQQGANDILRKLSK